MKKRAIILGITAVLSLSACGELTDNSSSSTANISYGTLEYSGQTYKTVKIGEQVWMAENLNYVPSGKDANGAWCLYGSKESCIKYGRLYDWSTVMNLPSTCDTTDCASQIQLIHQGICPTGWHIPTDDDWTALGVHLGSDTIAGTKLKSAAPDWDGTNSSGFSALPASYRFSDGLFERDNFLTYYWSSTQANLSNAWVRELGSNGMNLSRFNNGKKAAFSVRCIQD